MKVALVLALVACAAAMPSPDPGFVYSYTHPLAYSSYPIVKTVKADTPPAPSPRLLLRSQPSPQLRVPLRPPYGLPYSYPTPTPTWSRPTRPPRRNLWLRRKL
nr:uncharacterized protein LOC113804693 [Penaeus vannamei]